MNDIILYNLTRVEVPNILADDIAFMNMDYINILVKDHLHFNDSQSLVNLNTILFLKNTNNALIYLLNT